MVRGIQSQVTVSAIDGIGGAGNPPDQPSGVTEYRRESCLIRLAFRPSCANSDCMGLLASAPRILAVLGPTNTGKTHLAIERMLGHQTGMIGFPLRLLARENYDRVVRLKGARAVALITGEEKIVPPNPSYFVCTVESMPRSEEHTSELQSPVHL